MMKTSKDMESIEDQEELSEKGDKESLSKYANLSKEELKKKAMEEFNIDSEEWEKEVEKEPRFSKETVDEIANLAYFAEKLEYNLRGMELVRTGKNEEVYIQKGKAIAGESLINDCVGIIKTFANPSMLISEVRVEDFNMQFEDAFRKISDKIIMKETNVDVNSIRSILKQFKDTFWNIGAILAKTGKNMDSYFTLVGRKFDDSDREIKSKYDD